ncbi:MAG: hypothetical protein AAGD47_14065 [Pseudomonadota bacterium]
MHLAGGGSFFTQAALPARAVHRRRLRGGKLRTPGQRVASGATFRETIERGTPLHSPPGHRDNSAHTPPPGTGPAAKRLAARHAIG